MDHQPQPVMIEKLRVCHWKAKPCGLCGKAKTNPDHHKKKGTCPYKRQTGCLHCGKAKLHEDHLGAPDSYSDFDTAGGHVYNSYKTAWQNLLIKLLMQTDLPWGLNGVLVEGEVSFGDNNRHDQGNHRIIIEKALGDALTKGGWLADDDWHRYEFGGFQWIEEGVSRLRLTIFPR